VRHYLLQSDDIHAAKKTLPDFLGKCSNLSHIVQVVVDNQRGRVFQQIGKVGLVLFVLFDLFVCLFVCLVRRVMNCCLFSLNRMLCCMNTIRK
jgi:hypothetical protein